MLQNIFLLIIMVGLPIASQADYSVGEDQYSFNLILDTCGDLLKEAIDDLNLPEGSVITYPEVMSYKYFKIEILAPGSQQKAILEFEYWTEDESHAVCNNVSAIDYIE